MKKLLLSCSLLLLSLLFGFTPSARADGNCCDTGSALNSACTNASGNPGTCVPPPHSEPYQSECQANNLYACIGTAPPAGCCLISNAGGQCFMGNGDLGTCRAPSGAMEGALCLPNFYYCGTQTSSGSFLCECQRTQVGGYSCLVVSNSCQGGLQPNLNFCSPNTSVNPCGGNATDSWCSLPCVPGGTMGWGEVGCLPWNPNGLNDPSKICLPGLVCQGGICMKPLGSVAFSEPCLWNAECGTCQSGTGITIQMTCDFTSGASVGMCNGMCGGGLSHIRGNDAAFCDLNYQSVNMAIGCIPVSSLGEFLGALLGWSTIISGGIAFIILIVAGFQYATSGGDRKRLQAAKELIFSALSGLVLIALSVVILNFLGVSLLNLTGLGF